MSDRIDMILEELREHRKESAERHEKIDTRIRSLEESRAHQKGSITAIGIIATIISGFISFVVSTFKH